MKLSTTFYQVYVEQMDRQSQFLVQEYENMGAAHDLLTRLEALGLFGSVIPVEVPAEPKLIRYE